jgi:hypothetical protein
VKGGRKNWDKHETKTTNEAPPGGAKYPADYTYDWLEVGVQATGTRQIASNVVFGFTQLPLQLGGC